ncbi:uncharacterized protein [Eurosta solidaginis]|uniref:uncharacterized protein n=1 Tax=Eurosta solidaginis TaxID=178769 RepID=UPI003530ADD8
MEEKKSKVVSNKRQIARLVQLMQEHPDLGKGVCGKAQGKSRWELIAAELNSLGPPMRSWEKWLKVWTDLKSKTKKKCSQNRMEYQATGGGTNNVHTFSAIEEAIISFLSIDAYIDPPGEEIGMGNVVVQSRIGGRTEIVEDEQENEVPERSVSCEIQERAALQATPARMSKNISEKEKRLALLEKQIDIQSKHFKALKRNTLGIKKSVVNIEGYMRRLVALNFEAVTLKQEKLEIE